MDLFGFGASVLGGLFEQSNTDSVNAANAQALERQIAANKETMQNRHQWEVADLRAAGLNPLMSVSSPTGTLAAPNASPAQKSNSAQALYQIANLQMQDKQLGVDKINAEANLTNAKTAQDALEQQKYMEERKQDFDEFTIKEQLKIQMSDSIFNQRYLASATSLNDVNRVAQELENKYIPMMRQAQLDRELQAKTIDWLICQGQLTLMDRQGRAAETSAAAQLIQANSVAALNAVLAECSQAQREAIMHSIKMDKDAMENSKYRTALAELFAAYDLDFYGGTLTQDENGRNKLTFDSDSTYATTYHTKGIIGSLPFIKNSVNGGDAGSGLGVRFGRFGVR